MALAAAGRNSVAGYGSRGGGHDSRNRAYLQKLEDRNRLQRQLREAEERQRAERLRREQGFNCCFSGANVGQRFGSSLAGGGPRPAGLSVGGLRVGSASRSRSEGPSGGAWRQWEERTVQLMGADGEVYGIRPSGERVQAAAGHREVSANEGDGGGRDRSPSAPSVAAASLLEALASVVEGGAGSPAELGEGDGAHAMCSTLREHELARAVQDGVDLASKLGEGDGAHAMCSTMRECNLACAVQDGVDLPGERGECKDADSLGGTLRGFVDAALQSSEPEVLDRAVWHAELPGADGTTCSMAAPGSPAANPLRPKDDPAAELEPPCLEDFVGQPSAASGAAAASPGEPTAGALPPASEGPTAEEAAADPCCPVEMAARIARLPAHWRRRLQDLLEEAESCGSAAGFEGALPACR